MGNRNINSTSYVHNDEPNTNDVTKAMEYNELGQPIIRTTGSEYSWGINVSAGNISGMSYIEKFGMNIDVDSNKETIWDGGDIYEYIANAETVAITSSSANDAVAGTGARTVEVQGLDQDWNPITETLTVGGGVGTTTFRRVFRARVVTAGTNEVNEGTINITSNSTSTVLAYIGLDGSGAHSAGRGQTFMAMYTVPAGKTAYITQWTVGAGKQNTDAVGFLMYRDIINDGWQSKDVITVSATTYSKNYVIPLMVPEKFDIEVRAYSTTNNSLVSSTFNIILIDNP